jgi:hypothetical protein
MYKNINIQDIACCLDDEWKLCIVEPLTKLLGGITSGIVAMLIIS